MNMEMGDKMGMDKGMCKCPHHKVKSLGVLVFGISLLLNALGKIEFNTVYIILSILVIVMALGKMCRCCSCMWHKDCGQDHK